MKFQIYFFHDSTERPIQRPTDPETQKETYYSGKKKQHTHKNNLVIDAACKVVLLTPTCEGRIHDKCIADTTGYCVPNGSNLLQDSGFQGFSLQGINIIQPKKKPKGRDLTLEEKEMNRLISSIRVREDYKMKRLCLLVYLIGMLLITGTGKGHTQMDTKSLISLLNFSKTLIQDGEIKYLLYEKFFVHPDEAGDGHRKTLAFREQELRDAHKAPDPESFRKAVLENIEKEKKFGWYGDADEHYPFLECDLVFRVHPESMEHDSRFDYRLYTASQFENYPSVKYARFFG